MKKLILFAAVVIFSFAIAIGSEQSQRIIRIVGEGLPPADNPIILDTQEEMIAYDGTPTSYWPGLIQIGTKFAVRFTPLQPCTLTYIQVVSYNGAGNALIHVWDDNGGSPGNDLITPFTANLNGNINYQQIMLPEPIDVGQNDFHAGVEYTRAPPPFVTGDNDGNTENRSKYTTGSTWNALDGDLNIRAFVNYYGADDQVPPVITHVWQALGFTYDGEHHLTAGITDASGIASAEIDYSQDGDNWETVPMTNTSGDTWEGSIPLQEAGTTIFYYLHATDASDNANETFAPPTAPTVPYTMQIVEGTEIANDDGTAEAFWIVDTSYVDNAFAVRLTPEDYPAKVTMARAFVNGDSTFNFTINGISSGAPGDILPGGEPTNAQRQSSGWGIGEWVDGPVINSGSFFVLLHWQPNSPGNPGVGQDQDNVALRSYWYHGDVWNLDAGGEYMLRCIVTTPVGIREMDENGSRPARYELLGNFPNPFNPTTEIKYLAPQAGQVKLEIFNIAGQRIKILVDESVEAGLKTITWDGTNDRGSAVTSGVYFYRLTAGAQSETRKMILLK